ncbi:MAG: hypothetical protein HDR11_17085 [Lachnospiraceae bacterium]|nr:hypothetical protein [Lachnospiraceae bacterium]
MGHFLAFGAVFYQNGHFYSNLGHKKCPKQDFHKVLCGRKTHFSHMQILIFPASSPHSTTSPPPFPPSFSPSSSQPSSSEISWEKTPETPRNPREHGFLPLHPSTIPEKGKEEIPKNTIFLGFLRGSGRKPEKEKPERD